MLYVEIQTKRDTYLPLRETGVLLCRYRLEVMDE